ncbi:hypothetical protein MKW94_015820 [Papaver nudicaule]|uniref:Aminotransferase class V domain-containing protein n=1 Tax=Papaver nudicaule TaxID=74823 RepID=A0AA42AVC6_PAPNU|nr:hypothetical protein [Papaver nudicaule]
MRKKDEEIDYWKRKFFVLQSQCVFQKEGLDAIDVEKMNVSLMSLSGHKNYGPKGRGIRSGTVPTPLVVGMGAACELAAMEIEYDEKRITAITERFTEHRYAGNMNLSFSYVEGETLLMGLKEVAVSSGNVCTSASLEPSYVLRALGEEDMAHTSIRVGIGRFTTEAEIDRAMELTVKQVQKLREVSPLYEMVKEGIDIKIFQNVVEHQIMQILPGFLFYISPYSS